MTPNLVSIDSCNCLLPDSIEPLAANVDWTSVKSSRIHLSAISQEMLKISVTNVCFKLKYKKVQTYLSIPVG